MTGSRDGSLPQGKHNLPAEVESFVGRERELAEIREVLTRMRRLTLTGVGGSGKTPTALRAVADLVPRFAGEVWIVQLAPLMDVALVPRRHAEYCLELAEAVFGIRARVNEPTPRRGDRAPGR